MAECLDAAGYDREAEYKFLSCVRMQEQIFGVGHQEYEIAVHNLISHLKRRGKFTEVLAESEPSVATCQKL